MARIVGNEGSVSVATYGITANAWSMSISRVVNDVTAFDDASAKVRGGLPTYSGSVSGFMDDSDDPNLVETFFETGDVAVITLIAQTGNQWSGSAVISGVSISSSKTGDATISLDFTYNGGVSETWG